MFVVFIDKSINDTLIIITKQNYDTVNIIQYKS